MHFTDGLYASPGSTIEERFWFKVRKGPECWNWIGAGANSKLGYGFFYAHGKQVKAHRFSYEMAYGPIPDGMFVCHRCDNPACIRPEHLFLGNPHENVRDMDGKGRRKPRQGEAHQWAKLTDAEAQALRDDHARGNITYAELGAKYGVAMGTAWAIVKGKRRKTIQHA